MKTKKLLFIMFFIGFILLVIPNMAFAKDITVMLDAGHGGWDSGATRNGLVEKDINLKIAKKVKAILDKTEGITGILTRNADEYVSIEDRGKKARDYNADLLVSFHINSTDSSSTNASGAEVYITANKTERRFNEYSTKLAENILSNLRDIGVRSNSTRPILKFSTDGELYEDGTLSDWYGIIRHPMYYKIPGMIIEHAYINNSYDRERYLNDTMLERMAEADAKAIIANKNLFVKDYRGDVAPDIQEMTLISKNYKNTLSGEILVTEWIDGVTWAKPKTNPKIRLKDIEGNTVYECLVNNIESNRYKFEIDIDEIDKNKKYKIEVESGSVENVSPFRKAIASYNINKTLGKLQRCIVKVENGVLEFDNNSYYGDIAPQIIKTELAKNEQGRPFIKGEIYITEWLGSTWSEPDVTPIMTLVDISDNQVKAQFWVNKISGNKYYFDQYIDGLDMTKQYIIKVQSNNPYNISNYRIANVNYTKNLTLGKYNDYEIKIQNSKLVFTRVGIYRGDMATQIQELELLKNERGTYIKGEIFVTEWLNGSTWSIPRKTPKMTIKEINGTENYGLWVNPIEGNKYYFDGYIDGMSEGKEYKIEVESGSNAQINTSPYRIVTADYPKNKALGTYEDKKVKIENNKITLAGIKYSGDIATEIKQIELMKNEKGTYIKGEIIITEWLNGITWSIPKVTPIMRIKQLNSEEIYGLWVKKIEGNRYYFDGYIDSLDTNNQYTIEVETGSKNNTSAHKIATAYYPKNKELGMFKNSKFKIENNIFKFIVEQSQKIQTVKEVQTIEENIVKDIEENVIKDTEENVVKDTEENVIKDTEENVVKDIEENVVKDIEEKVLEGSESNDSKK